MCLSGRRVAWTGAVMRGQGAGSPLTVLALAFLPRGLTPETCYRERGPHRALLRFPSILWPLDRRLPPSVLGAVRDTSCSWPPASYSRGPRAQCWPGLARLTRVSLQAALGPARSVCQTPLCPVSFCPMSKGPGDGPGCPPGRRRLLPASDTRRSRAPTGCIPGRCRLCTWGTPGRGLRARRDRPHERRASGHRRLRWCMVVDG